MFFYADEFYYIRAAAFVVMHMYTLGLECAALTLILFLVLFLLYFPVFAEGYDCGAAYPAWLYDRNPLCGSARYGACRNACFRHIRGLRG